jgi:hypothetical protein
MVGGYVFIWVVMTLLASFVNGAGGLNSTTLTANLTAAATTATVQNTSGFLEADTIIIGGESITYTSKDYTNFYGLSRSDGVVHASGSMVYNQESSIINYALGFSVGSVASNVGAFSIFVIPIKFFTTSFPSMIKGEILPNLPNEFAILGYIWLAMTIGIVVAIGIALIWVASGIVSKVTGS